jgi:S-adenosylmethionine decarboxylase
MSNQPSNTPPASWPSYIDPTSTQCAVDSKPLDFFLEEDGVAFAGKHLIVDFWGVNELSNIATIEDILRKAIQAANATLLHLHLHHFTPNGGVSGVAVLAESHISIHTWPEHGYAALDIFMCGNADPFKALEVLQHNFKPTRSTLSTHKRGVLEVPNKTTNNGIETE